jgi:hypothetical protein
MMRRLALALLALAVLLAASRARATPRLRTTADANQVEVGWRFQVTLNVLLDDDGQQVSGCKLFIPGAFEGSGPTMGQSQMMTFNGTQVVRQSGVTCTWSLRATTVGTFTLGPPSVRVGGVEMKGQAVTITVARPGTTPRPFDPFGALLRDMQRDMQGDGEPEPELQVPLDPKFALDKAPDTLAFVHGTVDKPNAVVGEQVTLDLYLYLDATLTREPDITDLHEAGTSDFLRENLLDPQMSSESVGYAKAGGRIYAVKRVRRYALFPLTTGELAIEPMRLTVGRSGERASERLTVRVSEPPVAGRPAGYAIGDVGQMTLSADVAPRTTPRGGALAVTLTLKGSGNLPSNLAPPTRPGVEWLPPEVHSEMKGEAGVWGGSRVFTFVAHPTKQGKLDLGAFVVPYWDPSAGSYAVARAELGVIDVTAGAGQADDALRMFDGMPPARTALTPVKTSRYLTDGPLFFPALLLPTALVGLVIGGTRLRERRRRVLAERAQSPETDLKEKLVALGRAERETDARALDAATMRALESATIAVLDVNVRGVGQERIAEACESAGAPKELAKAVRDLLSECAAARFAPSGAELEDARARAKRARETITKLGKPRRTA